MFILKVDFGSGSSYSRNRVGELSSSVYVVGDKGQSITGSRGANDWVM